MHLAAMPTKRDLLYRLITSLFLVHAATASSDIWQFHIDNSPAPPVEDEPPFSRNASRDRSLLKYQIPGIVGGYVGFVLVLGFALLTFGRRLRRAAQASSGKRSLEMEMVKLSRRNFDPSPISPSRSFRNWRRWGQQAGSNGASADGTARKAGSTKSPKVQGMPTFDAEVIEKDKVRRQQEMERLYAAVMAQNTKAPRSLDVHGRGFVPPELAHLDMAAEALYRPYASMPSALTAPSPSTASAITSAPSEYTYTPPPTQSGLPTKPRGAAAQEQQSYRSSPLGRLGRKPSSLRINTTPNQSERPISAEDEQPVDSTGVGSGEARARMTSTVPSNQSRRPLTPFPQSTAGRRDGMEDDTVVSATDIIQSYTYSGEELDEPRPLPSAVPHRTLTGSPPINYPSTRFATPSTANSSTRTLPLRMPTPGSSTSNNAAIPTPTRTTFLTPRQDHLTHFHSHLSPGRQAPGTNLPSARLIAAGLATPYSAYMPFSPVTPVTPGLRTRNERRREQREVLRREPCLEEDGVLPEAEMWGDGWD